MATRMISLQKEIKDSLRGAAEKERNRDVRHEERLFPSEEFLRETVIPAGCSLWLSSGRLEPVSRVTLRSMERSNGHGNLLFARKKTNEKKYVARIINDFHFFGALQTSPGPFFSMARAPKERRREALVPDP